MKYDDLLGAPYKPHGRGAGGYDCFGLVWEVCRRAGTPIDDPFIDLYKLKNGEEIDYIKELNVKEISKPKKGAIVEIKNGDFLHVGYMVNHIQVLHTTHSTGAIISPLAILKPIKFYEVVTNEN